MRPFLFSIVFLLAVGSRTIARQPCSERSRDAPAIGFNLVSWQNTDLVGADAWKQEIQRIRDFGIREVAIVTYRFVDPRTGDIYTESRFNLASPPSRRTIVAAARHGERLGMKVSLNPLIEIDNARGIGHQWRGTLNFSPETLPTFFENYSDYISEMAGVARAARVDRLYVGSELKALTNNYRARGLWSGVIARARKLLGSRSKLSYAANYDNYWRIPFWVELDEIGIDAYFPLATASQARGIGNPSAATIERRWQLFLNVMERFSDRYGKPIIISEWGVVPFDRTTHQPWRWQPSNTVDRAEQLNAYQAVIDTIGGSQRWLEGIHFWHWGMVGSSNSAYSIAPNSSISRSIMRCRR